MADSRDPIARITKLLTSDAPEKRIAAVIVLAEIGAHGRAITDAIAPLLADPVSAVQRNAIDALARVGIGKTLGTLLSLATASRDPAVREAAGRAIVSAGDEALPLIRSRLANAQPEERRVLDALLAQLGGSAAFTTLLASVESSDEDGARAAALHVRHEVKNASAAARRGYLAQTEKLIARHEKVPAKQHVVVAGLKILGYLEDERAIPTLVKYLNAKRSTPAVRQEALLALRFCAKKLSTSVINTLLDVAGGADRSLAHAALHTLATSEIPESTTKALAKLARHDDVERAAIAIEAIARPKTDHAFDTLAGLLDVRDERLIEAIIGHLKSTPAAGVAATYAFIDAKTEPLLKQLRPIVRAVARELPPPARKKVRDEALARAQKQSTGWEMLVEVAREADPKAVGAGLRDLAAKLRRSKKLDEEARVLQILVRGDHANDDDRFRLASLALVRSTKDPSPAARARDEAIVRLNDLVSHGFDVARALKGDRSLELDDIYYAGFHFAEEGHPLGEDLLNVVAERGGRSKVATMAKNKLKLAAREATV